MSRRRLRFAQAALCAAAVFLAGFVPCRKTVSVRSRTNPSHRIYSAEALGGFIISYTHSVNKGRVRDYFRCSGDGELTVEKTAFVSYGAGIPEPGETEGAVFSQAEEGYSVSNLNRAVGELFMAVGTVADHSLIIGGKEFFLKDYFPPQTGILIKEESVSAADYFLHSLEQPLCGAGIAGRRFLAWKKKK